MSDPAVSEAPESNEVDPQEGDAKTFDAEYVKQLRAENARYRTEAKSNAKAAEKLAELENASKSEVQKAQDALTAAEAKASAAEAKALSLSIATEHKLGSEDAALLSGLADEDTMRVLAKRLAGQVEQQKKNGNRVPKEGTTTHNSSGTDEMRDFTRDLFSRAVGE